MHPFTLLFLVFLILITGAKAWLNARQIRHVSAHRDNPPPGFAFVQAGDHRKAADYTVAKARLGYFHILLDALLILAFTLGGGLAALQTGIGAWADHPLLSGALLIFAMLALGSLAELPLAAWRQFVVEARFGFNRMTARLFAADILKQALLSVILGLPVLALVLYLMESAGGAWWLYAWLAWSGFSLFVMWIFPTLIAPLFNRFSPLGDPELKARIEALLKKCGFRAQGVYVMDGSRRSSHGNAYFTGLGRAKRVVFFDTLLGTLDAGETEAVLAHELGHYRLHHIRRRLILSLVISLAGFWLLGWLMTQSWFYGGLGVGTPSPAAALALFMLVLPVFLFPLRPLASLYSRRHEFEADAFAASHADPGHMISALGKLYRDNAATLTPDPLHSTVYDSHPNAAARIAQLKKLAHT
jgi:STE24 endopeptidase